MIAALIPVSALLVSVAVLQMGNGLQGTLLPVRATIEQFASTEIGLIGTAYFIGFGLGCYFGGRLVKRAGHIRTFAAMASLASTTALLHALILDPVFWSVARCLTGFCFAVLYVVVESWLNERSTNETRGAVLSAYNIINLTVITVGQMMMTLYDPASFPLFILASVLVSMGVVPIAMTTSAAPAPVQIVRLRLLYLYRVSPLGCIGALAVGIVNGSFWTLGPVFALNNGMAVTGVAIFMSTAVLAGAAGQWPLGRLSDRTDRRRIILLACVMASLAGAITLLPFASTEWGVYLTAVVFGLFAFPLYSIAVAHLNDFIPTDEFVEASSGTLLLYALGAAIGPIPAALAMDWFGPAGLFLFTACIHLLTAALAILRMRQRHIPQYKEDFVIASRTSPTAYAMDPRSSEDETVLDAEAVAETDTAGAATEAEPVDIEDGAQQPESDPQDPDIERPGST